jgi:hypothetical protein
MAFFRAAGAFEREDEVLTLTPKGRYLTVAMMRTMFANLNSLRDRARAALAPDERQLLFGDGAPACSAHAGDGTLGAPAP